jgi:hypothetical protein
MATRSEAAPAGATHADDPDTDTPNDVGPNDEDPDTDVAAAPAARAVPPRVVAVDWSGAADATARRKIWWCVVEGGADGGVPTALGSGRTRAEVTAMLAAMVREHRAAGVPLAIGLDFAFSLPATTLDAWAVDDGPALWARAARDGDAWLAAPPHPFWGRGAPKPAELPPLYRATELEVQAATGARPSTVFMLVGAAQVGAASLRGMPTLLALREAGARVWPFDDAEPGAPLVVEVWPRVAYRERVVKSDAARRAAYLDRWAPALPDATRADAARSDDAFDALCTALAMWDDRAALAALPPARDARERREGRIWWPGLPIGDR